MLVLLSIFIAWLGIFVLSLNEKDEEIRYE